MAGEGERVSVVVTFSEIGNTESSSRLEELVDLAHSHQVYSSLVQGECLPYFHQNWEAVDDLVITMILLHGHSAQNHHHRGASRCHRWPSMQERPFPKVWFQTLLYLPVLIDENIKQRLEFYLE